MGNPLRNQHLTRKLLTVLSNVVLVQAAFIVRIIVIVSNGAGYLARRGRLPHEVGTACACTYEHNVAT